MFANLISRPEPRAFPTDNRKPRTEPLLQHVTLDLPARHAVGDAGARWLKIERALKAPSATPAMIGVAKADIKAMISELRILRAAL